MTGRQRRRIVAAGRRMLDLGLVTGSVGNVSARAGDRVLITPSAQPYGRMRRRDLVVLDAATGAARSRGRPSREAALHLAVYARRPDVGAVVHTHSAHATAWSFLGEPLGPPLEELAYYDVGPIRTAPYRPPGSPELAEAAARTLGDSRAVLLARHGVVCVGATVDEALTLASVVEHQARVALLLRQRPVCTSTLIFPAGAEARSWSACAASASATRSLTSSAGSSAPEATIRSTRGRSWR
jgi:L-fuculose-phosphate aldolase